MWRRLLLIICGLCLIEAIPCRGDDHTEFFTTQVEPLLKKRCFGCHSHASGKMGGDLAWDSASGWKIGGSRGPAIVPNDIDKSLLIQAVRHTHPELKMPAQKLADTEIAVFVRWVEVGAPDPRVREVSIESAISTDWWSLRPLNLPPIPMANKGRDSSQTLNPIDAFLNSRLEAVGLVPTNEADRRILVRRLVFDLHGLPADLSLIDEFSDEVDPLAWEKLVERLLASPRYGERWARHWLDTIHFADSHGFEHDVFRPHAWRFRDYVIAQFNADVPWSDFVEQQLAVDRLNPEANSELVALGFLGAGTYDHSAAITAPMSFENLDRDDLVTQVTGSFLSTTANCARCHDHKFDPIKQEDYYALQAVFAGIGKGNISYDADPSIARERNRWKQLKGAVERADTAVLLSQENQSLVAKWLSQRESLPQWQNALVASPDSSSKTDFVRQPDGSYLATGTAPEREVTSIAVRSNGKPITAFRLDVLTDDSLPNHGPGRAVNGNLHLTEVTVRVTRADSATSEPWRISRASSDFDQAGWTIQHAVDGKPETGWGLDPQEGKPHSAVFELERPLELADNDTVVVQLHQEHGRQHVIGRFALYTTSGPPALAIAFPQELVDLLAIPDAARTADQNLALSRQVCRVIADRELARLPALVQVYAAAASAENERGVVAIPQPRAIRLLKRGNVEQPGDTVTPGTLSSISGLPSRFFDIETEPESARRLALARWITDRQNPLTWRSIANRVWHYHFGKGICDTPSDFGRMGGTPTHPELLDWMACEIRDHGGSLKSLHRLICSSAAYRRSSLGTPAQFANDPENRLLARFGRQRLDADGFHDAVIAVSGRLNVTMQGPGVSQFSQRPGAQLTPILDYSDFHWDGPNATRRAIYRVVWRGISDPVYEALDFPDLGLLAPTRGFSASPLQVLVMMNNRFVLHHANHLADRAQRVSMSEREQLRAMARWCWLRELDTDEMVELETLARSQGMQAVARLFLNSNEFLFVD